MSTSEPNPQPVRPTHMKTISLAAVLAFGVVLAGCGDSTSSETSGQDSATIDVGSCTGEDAAIKGAKDIATLDLDGDGTEETLRLTTEAPCADLLFAISGEKVWSTQVDPTAFEEPAKVITRPGVESELLLASTAHPRGGFQATVYAAADGKLGELQVGDRPLLDFVATDVEMPGMSARCSEDGSLVVRTAAPTNPPGVLMAYDVFEQSFTVAGLTATPGERTRLAHSVPDSQMQERYPELFKNTLFPDCTN